MRDEFAKGSNLTEWTQKRDQSMSNYTLCYFKLSIFEGVSLNLVV
jgi:hypothetical protein